MDLQNLCQVYSEADAASASGQPLVLPSRPRTLLLSGISSSSSGTIYNTESHTTSLTSGHTPIQTSNQGLQTLTGDELPYNPTSPLMNHPAHGMIQVETLSPQPAPSMVIPGMISEYPMADAVGDLALLPPFSSSNCMMTFSEVGNFSNLHCSSDFTFAQVPVSNPMPMLEPGQIFDSEPECFSCNVNERTQRNQGPVSGDGDRAN